MPDHPGKGGTDQAVGAAQRAVADAARPAPAPGSERRRNPRIRLPRGFLALIGRPDSQAVAVSPRDLSRTGLGFYHGVDLQVGTRCTVTMKALNAELVVLGAKVVRRRQVRERVFDIGVEFEREIDTERFVAARPAPRRPSPPSPESAAQARAQIADLASSMKQMAEAEAPLNDLFEKIEEMVRLCDSARPVEDDQ